MFEAIIGVVAIVVAIGTYYAGRRDGRRQDQEAEEARLASKVADEYVALARPRIDAGPHA